MDYAEGLHKWQKSSQWDCRDTSSPLPQGSWMMPLPEVRRKTPLLTACRVVRARGCMLPKGMDHILSWRSQLQSQSHNRLYLHLPESKHFNSELKEQTLYYESTQAGTKHIPLKEMKADYKSNLVMSRTSGAQIKVHFHILAAVATNYISAEAVQTFYIQRTSQQKHCQSCWMYSIAAILICMVLVSNQYSPCYCTPTTVSERLLSFPPLRKKQRK